MRAAHTIPMGGVRRAVITDRCPWSEVYTDPVAQGALKAYGARERFGILPPGRTDPRLLEGMSVIASEHDRVLAEDVKPK